MDEINNISAFVKIAEKGSFTSAAFALNCSTSSISKRINHLEHAVGTKLLLRSTHGNAKLTEAGTIYFDKVRRILHELESAKDSVRDISHSLHGSLKIHLTPGTGLRFALPVILRFAKMYPTLDVEISVQPESYDMLHKGFDVSIHSGSKGDDELSYATVDAHELIRARHVICASRAYFEEHGKPSDPRELVNHNCLVSVRQPSPAKWWFRQGRKRFFVNVSGTVKADNWPTVYEAAKAGIGIARMLCVNPDTELSDDLEPILSDQVVSNRSVWALTMRMRPLPRKIEIFLAFLTEELNRSAGAIRAPLRRETMG